MNKKPKCQLWPKNKRKVKPKSTSKMTIISTKQRMTLKTSLTTWMNVSARVRLPKHAAANQPNTSNNPTTPTKRPTATTSTTTATTPPTPTTESRTLTATKHNSHPVIITNKASPGTKKTTCTPARMTTATAMTTPSTTTEPTSRPTATKPNPSTCPTNPWSTCSLA